MKKYSNPTHGLKTVEFEDGDAQFLMAGESFKTDKPVKRVQDGVVVKDIVSVKPKTTTTTAKRKVDVKESV
jgi:hypothetical protein